MLSPTIKSDISPWSFYVLLHRNRIRSFLSTRSTAKREVQGGLPDCAMGIVIFKLPCVSLQALAEEKAQAFKARELEIALLRAQQEKAQDQEAQRDELRAKRSAIEITRLL